MNRRLKYCIMLEDRQNSLLTKGFREHLENEDAASTGNSKARTTRTRIRDRIKAGIQDFEYLADPDGVNQADIELILDDESSREDLVEGLPEMVAFIYRVQPERLEELIEVGVQRGINRFTPEYVLDQVTVSRQKTGVILDRARRRMEEDKPLTDRQVRELLLHGDIDPAEVQKHVQNHPEAGIGSYRRRYR